MNDPRLAAQVDAAKPDMTPQNLTSLPEDGGGVWVRFSLSASAGVYEATGATTPEAIRNALALGPNLTPTKAEIDAAAEAFV